MTNLEKQFLTAVVNERRRPSVTGSIIEGGQHTQINSPKEASRLLESEDYTRGWEACHRAFHEAIAVLVKGELKQKDMKRYVEHSKRKSSRGPG